MREVCEGVRVSAWHGSGGRSGSAAAASGGWGYISGEPEGERMARPRGVKRRVRLRVVRWGHLPGPRDSALDRGPRQWVHR